MVKFGLGLGLRWRDNPEKRSKILDISGFFYIFAACYQT